MEELRDKIRAGAARRENGESKELFYDLAQRLQQKRLEQERLDELNKDQACSQQATLVEQGAPASKGVQQDR